MKSPFPGMDPWLEGWIWSDLHHELASSIRRQLLPQVKPNYLIRIETQAYEDLTPDQDVGILYPDVEIMKKQRREAPPLELATAPPAQRASMTPATLNIPAVQAVEARIPVVEIRDRGNHQLVTAIEVLSPVNKRIPGIVNYRKKRVMLHNDGVHLLEIDLLRRGEHPFSYPTLPPWAHYFVMLVRGDHYKTEVWAMTVSDPLPVVPVPLKAPDEDVQLDLGAALADAIEQGEYADALNYDEPPPPPAFSEEDQAWLRQLLASR